MDSDGRPTILAHMDPAGVISHDACCRRWTPSMLYHESFPRPTTNQYSAKNVNNPIDHVTIVDNPI